MEIHQINLWNLCSPRFHKVTKGYDVIIFSYSNKEERERGNGEKYIQKIFKSYDKSVRIEGMAIRVPSHKLQKVLSFLERHGMKQCTIDPIKREKINN